MGASSVVVPSSPPSYCDSVIVADPQDLGKPVAQASLMNRWALVASGYAAAFPVGFGLAISARPVPTVVLLTLGLVLIAWVRGGWVRRALLGESLSPADMAVRAVVVPLAGIVSVAAAWHVQPILSVVFPASVLSAALMSRRRIEPRTIVLLSAAAAGPSLFMVVSVVGGALDRAGTAALALLVGAAVLLLERSQEWYDELVDRLNRSRTLSVDLAVTRERLRFAGDLHDIQGHSLQAIAMKADLVARLVDVDPEWARQEAVAVGALARDALADTRKVAHGYRETSLEREIVNAVMILRAAGIEASSAGDLCLVPQTALGLFGRLVREGTTNVLRHSRAQSCAIHVERGGSEIVLTMRNDGVASGIGSCDGSGLSALRERFGDAGGKVEVSVGDGRFEVTGRLPADRVAA